MVGISTVANLEESVPKTCAHCDHPTPDERIFGWMPRKFNDVETQWTVLANGQTELIIDHPILTGVTVDMLLWWFQNLDGFCDYGGATYRMYHLWHPRDHVSVTLSRDENGQVGPGQTMHIHELLGGNPKHAINNTCTIHRLDSGGIGIHSDRWGRRIMSLDHSFQPVDGGVKYYSVMRLGMASGWMRPVFNLFIRRFPSAAWMQHNIEEVGYFVDFLPALYGARQET